MLRYIGWGPSGDQSVERDNESLRLAIARGLPIHVFEKLGKNRYFDHGQWIGSGAPEFHLEPSTGRKRVVFILTKL